MEVLYLTIFLSFSLAVFFLFLFVRNLKNDSKSSPEQSSLIPFKADDFEADRPANIPQQKNLQ